MPQRGRGRRGDERDASQRACGTLDEGGFLATSDDVPELVAQARTVAETLEFAQDVARSHARITGAIRPRRTVREAFGKR